MFSLHREENVDSEKQLDKFISLLKDLHSKYNLPIIVSTHPRTRKKLEGKSILSDKLIKFMKPFGFIDYIKLQKNAFCVLSDSGTITEESSILNFPALNLREMHERPEGTEECPLIMVGLNKDRVMSSLEILKDQDRGEKRNISILLKNIMSIMYLLK